MRGWANVLAETVMKICALRPRAAWLCALLSGAILSSPTFSGVAVAQSSLNLQLSSSIGKVATPIRAQAPAASDAYRIGSDDVISVTVYQEPDLSVQDTKVAPDGTIAMPLLGTLRVAGLSSRQLHQLITNKLADGYLKQPNVTVKVDRQQLYYIKGEVESPGGYVLVDGLTVDKAIALAGGYTERAAKRSVTIVRDGGPDKGLEEAPVSTPIRVGDVITVEESFF